MRTPSYLDRYRNGEYTEVWAELVALGPAVRVEPLYSEGVAVAQEIMARVRHNLTLLFERLQVLNYRFAERDLAWHWRQPSLEHRATIDAIEQQYGILPMVLRAWYDFVGEVDLTGYHPKLNYYYNDYEPLSRVGPHSDPLVIDCFRGVDEEDSSFYAQDDEDAAIPPFAFEFARDSDTKAGTSGGGREFHIMIPCGAFDTPIFDFGHWTGTFIIPYLRTCFEWGGFPGLRHNPQAAAAAKDELEFLTKDLLPI
jgi:hypothetical protein